MMTDDDDMRHLDAFFDAARSRREKLPADLARRVLNDAARLQPASARMQKKQAPVFGRGFIFGGWPAWAGFAAACCTGFWIGIAPPSEVVDPLAWAQSDEDSAFGEPAEVSGFGWEWQED